MQGQLAAQTPSPVLIAKITGGLTSWVFSVVLSDGEVCKGRWAQVSTVRVAKGGTSATAPDTNGTSSVWDTVYGSGFYVSHVLGKKFYDQGSASGNHGTVVQMEMYIPEAEHSNNTEIKGVAKDTKDNIYKLVS